MLIGALAHRKLYQVLFSENSVMSFSLTKINNQILLDCDLVDVYRIVFVVMCFPNMLGNRVLETETNVPHTESKTRKSCPNHRKPWDMWVQRGQHGSVSDTALDYSWEHSLVWQWLRPNRAYSVYIPPASSLGDGAGRGEGRKQGMIDGFWKAFPCEGKVWSLYTSPANKALP